MRQYTMPSDFPSPAGMARATDAAQSAASMEWLVLAKISAALLLGNAMLWFRNWRDFPARPRSHVLAESALLSPLMLATIWAAEDAGYSPGVAALACVILGGIGVNELRRLLHRWVGK
jgi:hypothetical protein